MARGGRGGGFRNPANLPREQQVSKKVSWLLRHGATQEGLELGKGGYVNVQDALNTRALKSLKITFPELRDIVATNDKKRFSLVLASALSNLPPADLVSPPQEKLESEAWQTIPESDDPADYLIRANQGHSIKVDTEGLLIPIAEEAGNVPETVIHGTDEPAWLLILKSGGLRKMGRNHIHFASGLPAGFKPLIASTGSAEEKEAAPVISGMRRNATVLVYVDIRAALAEGIKFYISENGVILTEGNEEGFLPYEFFTRVESRKRGGGILMSDGKLPEGVVVNFEEWERDVALSSVRSRKGGRAGQRRGGGGSGKARVNDDERDLLAGVDV